MKIWSHPETGEGELFLINMNNEQFGVLGWSSKRKGVSAYDGEGCKLHFADWFPVFIAEQELQEQQTSLTELRNELRARSSNAVAS